MSVTGLDSWQPAACSVLQVHPHVMRTFKHTTVLVQNNSNSRRPMAWKRSRGCARPVVLVGLVLLYMS